MGLKLRRRRRGGERERDVGFEQFAVLKKSRLEKEEWRERIVVETSSGLS